MKRGTDSSSSQRRKHARRREESSVRSSKLCDVMVIAEKEGLLRGERIQVVRGECRKLSWPGQKNALELIVTPT